MLDKQLKTFLSQFISNKTLALINVLGLAAALTCCLFIALFVRHELGYDGFFRSAGNTYRLTLEATMPDRSTLNLGTVDGPIAPLLKERFPEILTATRMQQRAVELDNGEAVFDEEYFNLVDKNFFSVFDFVWLQGNPDLAFTSPNAVVLTESLARLHFGNQDAVGQTLLMDSEHVLTVSGVIADLPSNTHLTGNAFASFDLLGAFVDDPLAYISKWFGSGFYTYVVLSPETRMDIFDAQIADLISQNAGSKFGIEMKLGTIPLTDIHMKSHNVDELRAGGNLTLVYAFSAIGVGILLIACINFVNITTAWASRRSREVGMRKVLGATRAQLVWQFIGEALVLCALAMMLALACVEVLLPVLNGLLAMDLRAEVGNRMTTGGILLLATVALGLLAGWYPSLYLSAFRPAMVLKGAVTSGKAGVALRGGLVMVQFAIVIVLLVSTTVIQLQLNHTSKMDLGFNRDYVVLINATRTNLEKQFEAFRNALLQDANIVSVTSSQSSPLRDLSYSLIPVERDAQATPRSVPAIRVDYNYFDTYGIRLLAGRVFAPEYSGDAMSGFIGTAAGSVVINESAARDFGWEPTVAVGKSLYVNNSVAYSVVGVVANTVENARLQATPVVYSLPASPMAGEQIAVRVREGNPGAALAYIDEQWNIFSPDQPIRRSFLDDTIAALYAQETRQLQLSSLFSALAIIIACMGLYGLVAFSTECRTKEIGIRKVLGGSVWSIILLFTTDFSRLVLLANLVAWPIAYFAMERWLQNFAYRIDLTPLVFIGSGLIALCITWVTVGGTAAKAASAKPVLALRYE